MAGNGPTDFQALIDALQQVLAGHAGAEAGQQVLNILAATVQQQASQATMMQQHIQNLEAKVSAGTGSGANAGLVDTKTLGRVEKFRGARKDWADCSFAFRAFLGGVDSKVVEALHWAAAQTEVISSVVVDLADAAKGDPPPEDLRRFN